jgi:hypothetical protein
VRIATDRAIRKFYAGPNVERMNADIIAPELDFYPLVIRTGRPFDRKEIAFQRFWCDPSKGEERLKEFMRVMGERKGQGGGAERRREMIERSRSPGSGIESE